MDSSGFVIIDSHFRPVFANEESIRILGYPSVCPNLQSLDGVVTQKIVSFLPRDLGSGKKTYAIQFKSGRRLYHCRAFHVEDHWSGGTRERRIALLMERGIPESAGARRQKRLPAGMYEDPFSFTPDPKYYQQSRGHQEVFTSLRSLVMDRRGIAVVLASAGMGKTALLGFLADSLKDKAEVANVPGSFENNADLVRSVMAILGVKRISRSLPDNMQALEDWLVSKDREEIRVVLICDEAQDLNAATIQNLCFLTGLGLGRHRLLQVIFAGRQELAVKLAEPRLVPVSKEINVYCRLGPLDQAEVQSYVLHRLRIGGCRRQIFSSAAISAIALYSRGIPLNINMICRHCLSIAISNDLSVIDEKTVENSAYDLVLKAQPSGDDGDLPSIWGSNDQYSCIPVRNRRGLRLVRKP
jgi:general secretion pathway protein A